MGAEDQGQGYGQGVLRTPNPPAVSGTVILWLFLGGDLKVQV